MATNINLTYNNKTFKFSNNILKLSPYLEILSNDRESIDEPLTLLKCDDEIFTIFTKWFNKINQLGIVKYDDFNLAEVIFRPRMFKNCSTKLLVNIFNFGFYNQIKLLCDTIAYILRKSIIYKYDNKYYIVTEELTSVDNTVYFRTVELNFILVKMILKFMSYKHFNEQQLDIQKLIEWKEIYVIDYVPFINKLETGSIINDITPYYIKNIDDAPPDVVEYDIKYVVISYNVKKIDSGCEELLSVSHSVQYLGLPDSLTVFDFTSFEFGGEKIKHIVFPRKDIKTPYRLK